MQNLKYTLFTIFTLTIACFVHAQQQAPIFLWPDGAPGADPNGGEETVRIYEASGDHVISNIHNPSIIPYLPSPENNTGIAVIIAPGGSHRELWIDHEGHNVAKRLLESGIASFILKYRLAKADNSPYTVEGHSVPDMLRAIRLVRSRASEWNIDPDKIGIMGFSAGGHLATLTGIHADDGDQDADDPMDRTSSKPDFQALIYPAWTNDLVISENAAPAFIVGGYKDNLVTGIPELYLKFKAVNVPAELHIYANAGHGFGIRPGDTGPSSHWPDALVAWLYDVNGITNK